MHSRITSPPRLAAASAIAILAATAAGCTATGNSAAKHAAGSARTTAGSARHVATSARQAIQLAASDARDVNSYAATIIIRIGSKSKTSGSLDNVVLGGTVAEQLRPSLLADANFSTFATDGRLLPGGMGEIITPDALYIKLGVLTQALHTSKPWAKVPLSGLNEGSKLSLGSLFSQLQTSSPLAQAQLLADATNVRTVGTSTVEGVPVTEYSGTCSTAAATARIPASARGPLGQDLRQAGVGSARFQVWVDSQHRVRKDVVTETSSAFTETTTTTVTSINQPVVISVPTISQATPLPASALDNAAS
jgi:hypothetical protein